MGMIEDLKAKKDALKQAADWADEAPGAGRKAPSTTTSTLPDFTRARGLEEHGFSPAETRAMKQPAPYVPPKDRSSYGVDYGD
jgi:hypothetical protein